jgi:hypothetical protein
MKREFPATREETAARDMTADSFDLLLGLFSAPVLL